MCAWGILNIALGKVGMLIPFAHLFSFIIKISLPRNWKQNIVMGFFFLFFSPTHDFILWDGQSVLKENPVPLLRQLFSCLQNCVYHYPPLFPPATTSPPAILPCRYDLMLLKVLVLFFSKEHPKNSKDPVSNFIKEAKPNQLSTWNKPLIWSCNI